MTENRYVVKFNNGFWKVFDTETYGDVEKCYLGKDAKELAKILNEKAKK
jgi:hypothetical protein